MGKISMEKGDKLLKMEKRLGEQPSLISWQRFSDNISNIEYFKLSIAYKPWGKSDNDIFSLLSSCKPAQISVLLLCHLVNILAPLELLIMLSSLTASRGSLLVNVITKYG